MSSGFERELLTLLPRFRRFARSLARDEADADDLTQAALERALSARHQWADGTKLDAWVFRIMRNCWIDEARRRARQKRSFDVEADVLAVAADQTSPVDARAIDQAMNSLPDEQREVVALVLIEGLKYREAAEILDIPIGTLTSRLNRARHSLVAILEAV